MDNTELEKELFKIIKPDDDLAQNGLLHGPDIDYEDPGQVKRLTGQHLAKIFIATHKEKIRKEIDKLKTMCK